MPGVGPRARGGAECLGWGLGLGAGPSTRGRADCLGARPRTGAGPSAGGRGREAAGDWDRNSPFSGLGLRPTAQQRPPFTALPLEPERLQWLSPACPHCMPGAHNLPQELEYRQSRED